MVVLILVSLLLAGSASAAPIDLLDGRTAGFIGQAQQGPLDQPVLVTSYAEFTTTFGAGTGGLVNPYLAPSVAAFFVNGGQNLYVVRVAGADDASFIGTDGGTPGTRTGLQMLRDVPDVAVVAIPGATSSSVQAAMIAHCESLRDRIAILDPVSPADMNAVITQRAGLSSPDGYAALYFPWVQAAPAGVSLLLPPSGFVAGVYARTAPQSAPTGAVVSATGVSLAVNSSQESQLNPLGIDTIRAFVGQGILVWGARTLASNFEWRYVSVRRMGTEIEESIRAGTQWVLSEPNDETSWAQIRSDVGDFLYGRWGAGWLQGSTPSQAYYVHCDATTMTAQDVAEGRTIIQVGFAPLSPAEFVLLTIVQQRAPTTSVAPASPSFSLRSARPNPFGARTTLGFDLPEPAAATLQIHDVGGRLVRTLAAGDVLAAGHHDRLWDGCDDAGGRLSAGVYLVRLQLGERMLTRRVALVR